MQDSSAQMPRHSLRAVLLVSTVFLALVFLRSPNYAQFSDAGITPFAGDYLQEWIGGYVVRTDSAVALYDEARVRSLQHDEHLVGFRWDQSHFFSMVYPPFYYVLLSPLSYLPYTVSAWIFTLAMVGCYFATGMLLVRDTHNSGDCSSRCDALQSKLRLMPWCIVLALFFVPLIRSLTTGQKGTLCLLIFTGTYLLLKSKRSFTAGMMFGLLLFKPQLVVIIGLVMLVKKQWRFVAGAGTTGLLYAGIMFALGPDVCWQYVQFCTGVTDYVHTSGYDLYKSHCLYGFIVLLAGGKATVAVKCATALAAVLILGVLWQLLSRKFDPSEDRFGQQFSGLVITSLLLSPHLFTYDLTILLLPMWLLTVDTLRKQMTQPSRQATMWLVVGLFVVSGFSHIIAAVGGLQLTTLLMLGLLITLRQTIRGEEKAECRQLVIDCSPQAAIG